MQHGINPETWLDAPKLDKTSKNRKKSKLQQLLFFVLIIQACALVAKTNYEEVVFD